MGVFGYVEFFVDEIKEVLQVPDFVAKYLVFCVYFICSLLLVMIFLVEIVVINHSHF